MWPTKHFTADDLDAFHSEALSNEMRLHLETCDQCRRLVATDRQLLALLEQLPSYAPSVRLADSVMRKVAISGPAPVPILSFPSVRGPRLAALVALAAGLVASVAWSASNQAFLQRLLDSASTEVFARGWTWLQAAGTRLTEQPWFGRVAETWDSPVRLTLTVIAGLVAYSLGLVALRRLITPSVEEVPNANA
jgi:anti-sigma factor RsiW